MVINETLCFSFDFHNICPTLVMNRENNLAFWPIDNTKGGADPVIVRLRDVIMERVSKMDHISLRVPLAWTLILDKMMATKQRSITMKEVLAISSLTAEMLDEVSGARASEVLVKLGINVVELGKKLGEVIPKIIEVNFNPSGTKNQVNAGIDDVIDRILKSYS
jgi:hypothetical protein